MPYDGVWAEGKTPMVTSEPIINAVKLFKTMYDDCFPRAATTRRPPGSGPTSRSPSSSSSRHWSTSTRRKRRSSTPTFAVTPCPGPARSRSPHPSDHGQCQRAASRCLEGIRGSCTRRRTIGSCSPGNSTSFRLRRRRARGLFRGSEMADRIPGYQPDDTTRHHGRLHFQQSGVRPDRHQPGYRSPHDQPAGRGRDG